MLPKVLLPCAICTFFLSVVNTNYLTFQNVMVSCENANPADDISSFVTSVTANSLKPHLPVDMKCFKIDIEHATIPILYEGSISNIHDVNYLLLENDNIEEIRPGAFRNLRIQEAVSLKFNKLRHIRSGVFNDMQVPVLYLSFNSIWKIDSGAFDDMTVLESIHLDNNQLHRIDNNWFKNTPKLSKLSFQQNFIQEVPAYAFRNLVARKLNAPQIDLSKNKIRRINRDAFKKPNSYRYLSVASNELDFLDEGWLKDIEVNKLDISNNRFQCTQSLAAPYSTNFIDGNPWNCQCLQEIKRKEHSSFGNIVGEQSFRRCNILSNSLK